MISRRSCRRARYGHNGCSARRVDPSGRNKSGLGHSDCCRHSGRGANHCSRGSRDSRMAASMIRIGMAGLFFMSRVERWR